MRQILTDRLIAGEITRCQFLQLMVLAGELKLPTVISARRMSKSRLEALDALGYTIIIKGGQNASYT